ncbi:MAG: Hpt domain-containing protein [Gimesia sp.]
MKLSEQAGIQEQWRLIDREKLLYMTAGDVGFLLEMIELFLSYVPQHMENVKQAIEECDSQKLSHEAHACKGLIGNYTILEPYHLLVSLEDDAKTGQLDKSLDKYNLLEKEISQLIVELKMLVLQESNNVPS